MLQQLTGESKMSNQSTASTFPRILSLLVLACIAAAPILTSQQVQAQGLVSKAPSATTVTLEWTAPGDDGSTGTASVYDIRYSLQPITDLNWNSATSLEDEPVPQAAGAAESFTVTGLNPGTLYYFAMKAGDEVPNWSGLSNVLSVTTLDTTAPAAITDLSLESQTP
jgi:hypothetical protein